MRALVVAYFFPPKGGAGTQRFAKFCKYLPEHGVEPTVLTVDEGLHNPHAPIDDATLLREVPVAVERVATPARVPWSLRARRALRFVTDDDEWAWAAGDRAVAVARERRAEVVVTTLSPFACYGVGRRVQREVGIPWVLDLRDPWALDGWRGYPTCWHGSVDLARMRGALRHADFVIANVPECKLAYVELGADARRTVVIPNGFDEEDFAGAGEPRAANGPFRLVHMGTFHPADAPPGFTHRGWVRTRHKRIAPLGRSGFYLLQAVARLKERSPMLAAKLTVELYGKEDATHRELITRLGIGDVVHTHGYLPHRESIRALCRADAVFVPLHGIPDGERALVVPGKVYEALASERPLLAALPEGDGADLIRHLRAGEVVPPTDAEALGAALARFVEAHARGEHRRGCARADLSVFTRRRLTAALAEVLRAAVARSPAVDVLDPWRALGVPRGT